MEIKLNHTGKVLTYKDVASYLIMNSDANDAYDIIWTIHRMIEDSDNPREDLINWLNKPFDVSLLKENNNVLEDKKDGDNK